MILEATIALSIYLFVLFILFFRNKKWKSLPDKFVKYYKVVVLTIVYILPLSFHVYNGTDLPLNEFIPLFFGFSLWSLVPFILLAFLAGTRLEKIDLIFITIVALSIEITANLKVHFFPGSSTDGLIFIFLPIYQLFIVMPVCCLACYIVRKLYLLSKKLKNA
jgi:hypothetical protein